MSTKRRAPQFARTPKLTIEMVALFATGCEMLQARDDQRWEARGGRRAEYLALDKHLCWTLLRLPPHCASVLDPALDGSPPDYLSSAHGMFIDWGLTQAWRRALRAGLDARSMP
ncbi:hypothetical protein [Bradyrhizobium sp. HKCCYLR1023]|uniref:hypothetical protein n=1 Tax=Bradyrhizobium TaxID=374 RepID=UPI003EB89401